MASTIRSLVRLSTLATRSARISNTLFTVSRPMVASRLLSTLKPANMPAFYGQAARFSTSLRMRSEDKEKKPAKTAEVLKTFDQVKSKVEKVCKEFEKINQEKFTLEAHFINDLGLDSLDQVELVMAMESEFGFEIPDVEAEKLTRPIDVIKYICEKANIAVPK